MEKEITEGNKLIAEFMGIKKCKRCSNPDCYVFGEIVSHTTEQMKYASSWDWLMPVIEKIGNDYNIRITWCADGGTKGFDTTYIARTDIFDKEIADFGGFGAITNTWKCAVKFIEWYNMKHKRIKAKAE